MNREAIRKRDLLVLTQLYDGNHLNEDELSRAIYLTEMLQIELKRRLKKWSAKIVRVNW